MRTLAQASESQLYLYFADRDEASRPILADGLGRWELSLRAGLEAMAHRRELSLDVNPALRASQTLMLLQGGLLVSQVRRDPGQMRIAAEAVLRSCR